MNLVNAAKQLLYVVENIFGSENDVTSFNERFAAQQLFEILNSYRNSYCSKLYGYETLDFNDGFNDLSDERDQSEFQEFRTHEKLGTLEILKKSEFIRL